VHDSYLDLSMVANSSASNTKSRPALFRALGRNEPPPRIEIDGRTYSRETTYKHDSWAATAMYRHGDHTVVCKFNRTARILGFPGAWLGRLLARREAWFLSALADVPGIPRAYVHIASNGHWLPNAVAHDFIEGTPLSLVQQSTPEFFAQLEQLLRQLHRRRIAYVDLHKPENVLVGTDGRPYLIDFQISAALPDWIGCRQLLRILQQSDLYHMHKHRTWRLDNERFDDIMAAHRPWWIKLHRAVGVPFRAVRRRLLVALGVRRGSGMAHTEQNVEPGLYRDPATTSNGRAA
jgi:hypothetical protein